MNGIKVVHRVGGGREVRIRMTAYEEHGAHGVEAELHRLGIDMRVLDRERSRTTKMAPTIDAYLDSGYGESMNEFIAIRRGVEPGEAELIPDEQSLIESEFYVHGPAPFGNAHVMRTDDPDVWRVSSINENGKLVLSGTVKREHAENGFTWFRGFLSCGNESFDQNGRNRNEGATLAEAAGRLAFDA